MPIEAPDLDLAALEHERTGEGVQDPARHRGRAPCAVGAGTQHHELVASDAGEGVAGSNDRDQSLGDLRQCSVAHPVAECVVDRLEPVEIDEEHPDRLQGPATDGEGVSQAIEKERLVGQAGELVVEGLLDQALLGLALLGDVATGRLQTAGPSRRGRGSA